MSRNTFDQSMPWVVASIGLVAIARVAMELPGVLGFVLFALTFPTGLVCLGVSLIRGRDEMVLA